MRDQTPSSCLKPTGKVNIQNSQQRETGALFDVVVTMSKELSVLLGLTMGQDA